MTDDERHEKAQQFIKEFRDLVRKHAGASFEAADVDLLYMMQDMTSVFQPYIWSD